MSPQSAAWSGAISEPSSPATACAPRVTSTSCGAGCGYSASCRTTSRSRVALESALLGGSAAGAAMASAKYATTVRAPGRSSTAPASALGIRPSDVERTTQSSIGGSPASSQSMPYIQRLGSSASFAAPARSRRWSWSPRISATGSPASSYTLTSASTVRSSDVTSWRSRACAQSGSVGSPWIAKRSTPTGSTGPSAASAASRLPPIAGATTCRQASSSAGWRL